MKTSGLVSLLVFLGTVQVLFAVEVEYANYFYDGGLGTQDQPYQIRTAPQLISLANRTGDYGKYFILTADIDLSDYVLATALIAPDNDPEAQYLQGTPFTGSFDGDGHKITGLTIDASETNNSFLGLFGQIESTAIIQNLGVENVSITTGGNTMLLGSLVGYTHIGGTIRNCYATGSVAAGVNSTFLGGLTGANNGHIHDSYAMTNVSGGINCSYLGGLTGYNAPAAPGFIENCYSTGSVTAGAASIYLGGLIGANNGNINSSYAWVSVIGGASSDCLGGLCGYNAPAGPGSITNCYSTGTVIGNYHVGGLVGDNNTGSVTGSFWDTQTSGLTNSDGGTGKTTTQMQDINTFLTAGWDFIDETVNGIEEIWRMPTGGGYPILSWQDPPYVGGDGTTGAPYQISTASQLFYLAGHPTDYDKYFILTSDIDLSPYIFTTALIAPDTDTYSGWGSTAFTGTFDGNGHAISNLTIDGGYNRSFLGLFGHIDNGSVTNLALENVDISSSHDHVGGLCGSNHGNITNCYSTGTVNGSSYVGGLCGSNHGNITNCYSASLISGYIDAGGLCGRNSESITSCYSTATVNGGSKVGGLCGRNESGSITNCYSTGTVTGYNYDAGGLCGLNSYGSSITSCYSTGSITGRYSVGGLCGLNVSTIIDSFWDTETSGQSTSGGGEGKTTAQMQDINTFLAANWDFVNLWDICDGTNYPRFIWQILPGDVSCPDGVTLIDFAIFSQAWLTSSGQPGYNDDCDLINDDTINIADLVLFAENFLQGL